MFLYLVNQTCTSHSEIIVRAKVHTGKLALVYCDGASSITFESTENIAPLQLCLVLGFLVQGVAWQHVDVKESDEFCPRLQARGKAWGEARGEARPTRPFAVFSDSEKELVT